MIGLLFNNITPFASGGQPMQAYELTKTGKRVSDSLSAMAIKFIITQIALVVTTIVVIFFEFDFFKNLMQNYLCVAIVGFLINILAIVIVILVGIKKSIISSITTPIIKFLGKIHILKHPIEILEKLDKSMLYSEVNKLKGRDKDIIEYRYGLNGKKEMTQKEVAKLMGISQSYISRIEKKVIKRLGNIIII